MYKFLTLFSAVIIFYSCNSITGNGNIITEVRKVKHFDGIISKGSIDVEIVDGTDQTVKVEADENVLKYIVVKVDDGLLDVHYKSGVSLAKVHTKVFVSASVLNKISVSGSGSVISADSLKNNELIEIKVSGSGNVNLLADAPAITTAVSGSGTITLAGRTKDFKASIAGSGDLKCRNLLSENTTVKVSGSGTAQVYASLILSARVTGSGNIYYSGNPSSPDIKKTGSGSVRSEK